MIKENETFIKKTMSSTLKDYEWSEFPNLGWEEYLAAVEEKYGCGDEDDEDDEIDWDKRLEDEHIEYQRKEAEREIEDYERTLMSWEDENARYWKWVSEIDERSPVVNRAAKVIQAAMRDWCDYMEGVRIDAAEEAEERWNSFSY